MKSARANGHLEGLDGAREVALRVQAKLKKKRLTPPTGESK